ncbi:MAG: DUF1499 domain-containing protein [Saprospiraceae bacterium]
MSSYNPLKVCPPSPNCVCTIDTDPKKKMETLSFAGSAEEAKTKMKAMILDMKRTTLLEEREDYLHFQFKTFWGGFKDDVEFYFDESGKAIHFRSASRVGYSDLGANERRMKKVGKAWRKLK